MCGTLLLGGHPRGQVTSGSHVMCGPFKGLRLNCWVTGGHPTQNLNL